MLGPPLPTGQVSPKAVVSTTLKETVPEAVPELFPVKTPAQASLTVLFVAVLFAPVVPLWHELSKWTPDPELLNTVFKLAVL